jgi:cyanophycinase
MAIKGKLVIIGGAEDKGEKSKTKINNFYENGILKRILDEARLHEKSRIEILPTASGVPKESGNDYIKAFGKLNAVNTGVLNIKTREDAEDPEMLDRLKKADVLLVTGGDQMRLTTILGGTKFLDLLQEKYHKEDFIYAGTSAGAAAASNNIVTEGQSENALLKGGVKMASGLALINDMVIDTHFVSRGRIGRIFQIVVTNPRLFGVGLEENAALLITNNSKVEAIGPAMTILVDGRSIKDSNFNDSYTGESLSIEGITVHVMSKYDIYDLNTHKLTIDHSNRSDE